MLILVRWHFLFPKHTYKQTKAQTRKQTLSHHPVSSSSAPASAQSSAACASAARKTIHIQLIHLCSDCKFLSKKHLCLI